MNLIPVALLLSAIIPLVSGCAHRQQPESAAVYSPLPAQSPTSDNSTQRVYATTITAPGGAQATITQGSRSPAPDADIAETVREMMLSDPKIVPYPSKVTVMMDPNSKGKVILNGSVPTPGVKRDLVQRVSAVAGVVQVEDQLVVETPDSSRKVDLRDPTK